MRLEGGWGLPGAALAWVAGGGVSLGAGEAVICWWIEGGVGVKGD